MENERLRVNARCGVVVSRDLRIGFLRDLEKGAWNGAVLLWWDAGGFRLA